jgi:hypothetical protein
MKQSSFLILSLVAIFFGSCNSAEVVRLRAENDSLRRELQTRYSVVVTMRDIKYLIDSIDLNRNALHADLNEGTTYEDFTARMEDINAYVIKTESKIDTVEKELRESKGEAGAYMMMVDALKGELSDRALEIHALEKQVKDYKLENKGLVKTVRLQEDQIIEMRSRIETKQQELSLIDAKVTEMINTFKVSEAEAYYARGQAVEEAANRTRLAPNKKRETYKEAIELYRKALSLGKDEAQANITGLEKKIK